ncbi:MAG: 2-nitropropane dioxygenase [Actinomycetia bacterium]|nr:2-nitropropane dioxygenase [Actinomycetes bacterium]
MTAATGRATKSPHPALQTRITELFGVEYPIVATGMGYVSDARLTAATSAAGGLGIIGSGLMSYQELAEAIGAVQSLTDKPFGVNVRADQPDVDKRIDLLIRSGVKVASFALAPRQELIARCKDGGLVVVPSIGAVRHAEKVKAWGADAVVAQATEVLGRLNRSYRYEQGFTFELNLTGASDAARDEFVARSTPNTVQEKKGGVP